jgi:hypothetical protein
VPADDLLAKGVRDGAGHEESSGVLAKASRDFIHATSSGVKLSLPVASLCADLEDLGGIG